MRATRAGDAPLLCAWPLLAALVSCAPSIASSPMPAPSATPPRAACPEPREAPAAAAASAPLDAVPPLDTAPVTSSRLLWRTELRDIASPSVIADGKGGAWVFPRWAAKGSPVLHVDARGSARRAWTIPSPAGYVGAADGTGSLWLIERHTHGAGSLTVDRSTRLVRLTIDGRRDLDRMLGTGAFELRSIAVDAQGVALVAGTVSGRATLGAAPIAAPGGGRVEIVAALDREGEVRWVRPLNDVVAASTLGIAVDATGRTSLLAELHPTATDQRGPALVALTPDGADRHIVRIRPASNQEPSIEQMHGPWMDASGASYLLGPRAPGGVRLGVVAFEANRAYLARIEADATPSWIRALEGRREVAVDSRGAIALAHLRYEDERPMLEITELDGMASAKWTERHDLPPACQPASGDVSIAIDATCVLAVVECKSGARSHATGARSVHLVKLARP